MLSLVHGWLLSLVDASITLYWWLGCPIQVMPQHLKRREGLNGFKEHAESPSRAIFPRRLHLSAKLRDADYPFLATGLVAGQIR
ncbi:MAG TPA: hypothetical protein VM165_10275 [Planctomycetaceae bacterium]|nr:hypothetical protein [Planctomycetaceae bacterium]